MPFLYFSFFTASTSHLHNCPVRREKYKREKGLKSHGRFSFILGWLADGLRAEHGRYGDGWDGFGIYTMGGTEHVDDCLAGLIHQVFAQLSKITGIPI